jgi:hypothetical protein
MLLIPKTHTRGEPGVMNGSGEALRLVPRVLVSIADTCSPMQKRKLPGEIFHILNF